MHSYDKRFNVQIGRVSNYVNTPEEVLRLVGDRREEVRWIAEGYGDWRDVPGRPEISEVLRVTTGTVLLSTVEFEVARKEADRLIEKIKKEGAV